MKPFFVLLASFCLYLAGEYIIIRHADIRLASSIAMSVMLFFTAIGHFKFKEGMAMMLPTFIPARHFIIIVTGIIEMLLAVAIHLPSLQTYSGWLLLLMFICFLPANIYAASRHIDYETASYEGKGLSYLWFRIPFQLLLIAWTFYFII